MKKILVIIAIVLAISLLIGCGDNGASDATSNQSSSGSQPNDDTSSNSTVTDAYEMLFDFTIRQQLNDVDASVFQRHFFIDMTWDGLNFEAASVFTREVQHHSGRYDVQEDVVITGKLSEDEKTIETLTFRNERTGEIYEMLEFEFANIPYTDDNPYADSNYKFYIREGVDNLSQYIKVWNEQTHIGGDVRDITEKFESMANYDQEAEITISFYFD